MNRPLLSSPAMPLFVTFVVLSLCGQSSFAQSTAKKPTTTGNAAAKNKAANIALVPGLIRAAMATADTIFDPDIKAEALIAVGTARASAGNLAGAKETFAAAVASAQLLTDAGKKARTLEHIGLAQGKVRDSEGARLTLEAAKLCVAQIPNAEDKVGALAEIAAAQAKTGIAAAALQTFTDARQMADTIPDANARTFALSRIAKGLALSGDPTDAKTTAFAASQQITGDDPNSHYWRDRTRGLEVVAAFLAAGDLRDAVNMTDGIQNDYMKDSARWALVDYYGGVKDFANASQVIALVGNDFIKGQVWQSLASAQAYAGDVTGAQASGGHMKDGLPDFIVAKIAVAQARAGTISIAGETAAKIGDQGTKNDVLSQIVLVQAQSGDVAAAIQSANAVDLPLWKARTQAGIVEAIMGAGK